MLYFSTNRQSPPVHLPKAIIDSVAPDGGLYLPMSLPRLPRAFIDNSGEMSFADVAYAVLASLMGDELDSHGFKQVVYDSFNFDVPMVAIGDGMYALELFHGPTLSIKDISARFMSRFCLQLSRHYARNTPLNILLATTGNAGGAIADAIANLPDTRVIILFPQTSRPFLGDHVSSLASNVKAIEVMGNIDDCHRLVSEALADVQLREMIRLTTANSVNIIRLLPQIAIHFYAASRMIKAGIELEKAHISTPTGNMSNLTAAVMAQKMGVPFGKIIAASNRNDYLSQYLKTGILPNIKVHQSVAGAMDVGLPTSLPRFRALCDNDINLMRKTVTAHSVPDESIISTIADTYLRYGYLVDPNTATAIAAVTRQSPALILATGHPAKSKMIVERAIGDSIKIPERLAYASRLHRHSIKLAPTFPALRKLLLSL